MEDLYRLHRPAIRRFLTGVLRNREWVDEALQQTFVRVIERGHEASPQTVRGWIFKVAFHEALQLRRRMGTDARAMGRLECEVARSGTGDSERRDDPLGQASDRESIELIRRAVGELPSEQREVVRMRIHEGRSFAEIAKAQGTPLGTALTRMRLAMEKVRSRVKDVKERTL